MAKETRSGQLIFRGIFLLFLFGGDIIVYITEMFPLIGASGSEGLLGGVIFLVFLGPLLVFFLYGRLKKLAIHFGGSASTHAVESTMSIGGTNQQASYDLMASGTTKNSAQTVTGEKVNPFSINGD